MRPSSITAQRSVFVLALLFFCGFLWLYLATLTEVHTFDALSYVLDVDRKPWSELFHPHHLAYGALGVLVRMLVHSFGYTGSAVVSLQVTNALAGAAGVALFFVLVRSVGGRNVLALACALLLGASYAFWYYAVEVEVYTLAVLFLIGCLWLMTAVLRWPTLLRCTALGLMQGLAVLFHQTNVLLCVPALLAIGLAKDEGRGTIDDARCTMGVRGLSALVHRPWPIVVYGLALALVVGGSYLWVGFGVSGFRSLDQFGAWMLEYPRTGWWGGPISGSKWAGLGQGLSEALAQPGGAWIGLALLGLFVVGSWGWTLRGRRERRDERAEGKGCRVGAAADGERLRLAAVLLMWLLVYGGFFLWWEPDNIEFWIASLPPALLLVALVLDGAGSAGGWGGWVALALGVAALGGNYGTIARRGGAAYDLQRMIASEVAHASGAGDLLLVPDGLQELYLPFYEGREHVLSLNQALFATGGEWPAACTLVQEEIAGTLASGAGVVLAEEVLRPELADARDTPATGGQGRGGLLERFGLAQDEVAACFETYLPDMVSLEMGAGLPRYFRIASAQELADGPGWSFVHSSRGWRAANAAGENFAGAWGLTPGVDSYLLSPPLQIDPARIAAVEIRMAASTAARDGQLFLIGPGGQTDEARSVRWTLEPGAEMRTYRLDLRDVMGWAGEVTGLRLDPVGVGDGGQVRIESIRLIGGGK